MSPDLDGTRMSPLAAGLDFRPTPGPPGVDAAGRAGRGRRVPWGELRHVTYASPSAGDRTRVRLPMGSRMRVRSNVCSKLTGNHNGVRPRGQRIRTRKNIRESVDTLVPVDYD